MSEWFCKISDREMGPITSRQLRTMAAQGEIAATDWVRRGNDGLWTMAGRVQGLFASGGTASTAASVVPVPPPLPSDRGPAEVSSTTEGLAFGVLDEADLLLTRRLKDAMNARARRRQQKTMLLVGSVVFVAIGGIFITVFLLLGGVSIVFSGGDVKGVRGDASVASKDALPGKPPQKKVLTIETADISATAGGVPIQVIGLARGDDALRKDSCLLITVKVTNLSRRDKLNFTSWSRDPKYRGALLTDGHGREFMVNRVQTGLVLGHDVVEVAEPGGSVHDVLAFELPDRGVTMLKLELPGEPFGKNGVAQLSIPLRLIAKENVAVEFVPEKVKEKNILPTSKNKRNSPKPGTPEYDFGIEDRPAAPH